jgi:hypothetical protein
LIMSWEYVKHFPTWNFPAFQRLRHPFHASCFESHSKQWVPENHVWYQYK